MIGNDIVDLNLAKTQSNWQRRGFLEKQFTAYEQKLIFSANNPFLQVWLFWSMKEAVYKCYVQQYKKRFFDPKKFQCKIKNSTKGTVTIEEQKYITKSFISNSYIHSVAFVKEEKKMVYSSFFIDNIDNISQKINQKIISYFPSGTELKKNGLGIPFLYKKNAMLPFLISKSHHGNYGAFAIEKYR